MVLCVNAENCLSVEHCAGRATFILVAATFRWPSSPPSPLLYRRLLAPRAAEGSLLTRHCPFHASHCSLEEGLEETLTVHRLGVGWLLRRTLASTNPIESCLSTVERVARNVKRWREGEQALRWTATGLLEAQKKFRGVKGYRELELLHRRMNPSLTQQAHVA